MKFLNNFFIPLFLSSLIFIYSDITIIGPHELSSKFKNQQISMTFDKIGKSSYDFYSRGQLFIEENNLEACDNVKIPKTLANSQYSESFKILIAKEEDVLLFIKLEMLN